MSSRAGSSWRGVGGASSLPVLPYYHTWRALLHLVSRGSSRAAWARTLALAGLEGFLRRCRDFLEVRGMEICDCQVG